MSKPIQLPNGRSWKTRTIASTICAFVILMHLYDSTMKTVAMRR